MNMFYSDFSLSPLYVVFGLPLLANALNLPRVLCFNTLVGGSALMSFSFKIPVIELGLES